jgi:E3 ubiquitin-protein ligase HUWE1
MTQMLIRPVSGGLDALAKDPECFICKLEAQVLEVVLSIWNHPGFMHCDVTLINSIASIITHIYIGVGNVNGSKMPGVGGVGLHLIGQPLEESSISMIMEMGFSQVINLWKWLWSGCSVTLRRSCR